MKAWGKIKIEDSIKNHVTVISSDFSACLNSICEHFDLTKPIILKKHFNEIEQFSRTVFYPDDFIESVSFDTFEIEILTEKKK